MEILEIVKSEYLSILFGGLAGIITSWITQRIINKRGIFSYHVTHNRIGISTEDNIFGNVSVTWNEKPIRHLYLSTLELKNESLNDYENVVISAYTNNTTFLSESTQILETPYILELSAKFRDRLSVESGEIPTDAQVALYNSQREYVIPVFNRSQVVRINFLNSANSDESPAIWLSAIVKGVKVKFRVPLAQVLQVELPLASIAGIAIGFLCIFPLVILVSNTWIVALVSMSYGLIALWPGAIFIRSVRKIREIIGS